MKTRQVSGAVQMQVPLRNSEIDWTATIARIRRGSSEIRGKFQLSSRSIERSFFGWSSTSCLQFKYEFYCALPALFQSHESLETVQIG